MFLLKYAAYGHRIPCNYRYAFDDNADGQLYVYILRVFLLRMHRPIKWVKQHL